MNTRKRRWLRWLVEITAILLVFLLVQAWMTRDAPSGPAPDFSGVLLDGTPVSLADYRGKPLLLHFWATWCPLCGLQQGTVDALARDYPVLTVSIDEEGPDTVRDYLREQAVDYPVLHDADMQMARHYAISAVPTSFIIDPRGEVRFVERGYSTGIGLRLRLWWAGR